MIVEAREVNQNMEESQVQKQIGPTDSHILTLTLKLWQEKVSEERANIQSNSQRPWHSHSAWIPGLCWIESKVNEKIFKSEAH